MEFFLYKWLTVMSSVVGLGDTLVPTQDGNVIRENRGALPEWFLFLLNGAPEWFTRLPSAAEVTLGLILGTYMPGVTDTEGDRNRRAYVK